MTKQTKTTKENFKEKYNSLKTWGEAEKLLKSMNTADLIEMRDAMQTVQQWTGLDMREDFLLRLIPHVIEDRAMKVAPVIVKRCTFKDLKVLDSVEVKQ